MERSVPPLARLLHFNTALALLRCASVPGERGGQLAVAPPALRLSVHVIGMSPHCSSYADVLASTLPQRETFSRHAHGPTHRLSWPAPWGFIMSYGLAGLGT
ncbi:hypothetical protein NDU88_003261 [Pleurodeles waltl]|uniref:Secreted protein n=1 Tax=Pleurodeles waltl TaxID=8319 RepID=A0AAV7UZH6_PLEWA|nr:hypothetical protein NDU88_003261 [Pleurodeles waltl]